jgi:hypothetical protein
MPGLKRCLGVDLGGRSVKIVEMVVEKKGVRIERMVSAPVPLDPNALEAERTSTLLEAVRKLLKENKITTKQAVFCMPGQTVIVRPLRLPRAPGPRLHQIIHFEARQIIPFPLEKTLLQYQVFDSEDEREVEVLLVAMKKETNQEFMSSLRKMGLKAVGIGVSTLALYNGQELSRFNFDKWRDRAGLAAVSWGWAAASPRRRLRSPRKEKKKKPAKKKKKGEETVEEEAPVEEALLETPEGESDFLEVGLDAGFEEVRAYVNLGGVRRPWPSAVRVGPRSSASFARSRSVVTTSAAKSSKRAAASRSTRPSRSSSRARPCSPRSSSLKPIRPPTTSAPVAPPRRCATASWPNCAARSTITSPSPTA